MQPSGLNSFHRPQTFLKRRVEANVRYSYLFERFQTHNFLDWHYKSQLHDLATWDFEKHPYNVKEEVNLIKAVPPYCERFDEFLGYWLSHSTPINTPALLESYFPQVDEIDSIYLEDLLDELALIGGTPDAVYVTIKGSNLGIGPGVCTCYARNIARAQKWLTNAKAHLQQQADSLIAKPEAQRQSSVGTHDVVPLASLLKNGFSVEDLNQLLYKAGIIEPGKHSVDSKAGVWTAVIEALREKNLLDTSNSKVLHNALVQQYGQGNDKNLPSLRTIQRKYNPQNALAKHSYTLIVGLLGAK